jgi:hypothetical protein
MGFDFADLKQFSRQQLHDTLAVAALYSHPTLADPVDVGVRWHDRIIQFGDLQHGGMSNEGYAEVIEGIDQLVFDRGELVTKALVLVRGGIVEIPQYELKFALDTRKPIDGPVNEAWQVTRV